MANTDTNTIVGLAKDVGELKGLVSAQTSAMNDLSARLRVRTYKCRAPMIEVASLPSDFVRKSPGRS